MSAAAEEEANHWPGFVDALSTIVMVVTFLLIILAIAIFITSLTIAEVARTDREDTSASNLETGRTLTVTENPVPRLSDVGIEADLRNRHTLKLKFIDTTMNMDAEANAVVAQFVDNNPQMAEQSVEVVSYYSVEGSLTRDKRIAYYRLLSVRNSLLASGVDPARLTVNVRETPNMEAAGSVVVAAR